ncbi:MAG: YgjP-like metallopeptidase domain-containing protein, partial [Pseudomonadota bacterium]
MPQLTIGLQKITYSLRTSKRARRLRLTVQPDGVEVVVPRGVPARDVSHFVDSHRGWIREKVEKYQALAAAHDGVERLEDGAVVPFRGEPTPLSVRRTERVHPKVIDGDGFRLELPRHLPAEAEEEVIEQALTKHLKKEARNDAAMAIERFGPPNGLTPTGLRIKDQKRLW